MRTASRHSGFRFTVILWAIVAGILFLRHPPCGANPIPLYQTVLLVHVQPYSGSCETPLTDCHQIIRSTNADGLLEFLIFFKVVENPDSGEEACLAALNASIYWTGLDWELWDFDPCAGYGEYWGLGGRLNIQWSPCYPAAGEGDGIVLVARLVMNVVGPGQLLFDGTPEAVLSGGYSYPDTAGAEAGIPCGHDLGGHCGIEELACLANFESSELPLTAPSGGVAEGAVDFTATISNDPSRFCTGFHIDTHAPWCSARIEWGTLPHGRLRVTADASGLEPGTHETAIELAWGNRSRCLPVEFTVEEPTATSAVSWGRVKSIYR